MKHLIFSLLTICSMTAHAQQIVIDQSEPDGLRTIATSLEACRNTTDKTVFSFGLTAYIKTGTSYTLNIKATSLAPIHIAKGAALLIKTFKGTTIELQNIIDADGSVRDVHEVNGYVFSDYSAQPSYTITSEQIQTIASEGLSKLRIQTSTSNIDKEYKKDKAGKVIDTDYRLIQGALNKSSDIHDGF